MKVKISLDIDLIVEMRNVSTFVVIETVLRIDHKHFCTVNLYHILCIFQIIAMQRIEMKIEMINRNKTAGYLPLQKISYMALIF